MHYTRCHKARLILLLLVYETEILPGSFAMSFSKSTSGKPVVFFVFAVTKEKFLGELEAHCTLQTNTG